MHTRMGAFPFARILEVLFWALVSISLVGGYTWVLTDSGRYDAVMWAGGAGQAPGHWAMAVPVGIVAALVLLAFIPYGGEIGIALLGITAAVALYRHGK